jgi:hypothetical protein
MEMEMEATCSNCFGSPVYFPNNGFPKSCYPYCGMKSSPDYMSPVVMVKFKNISNAGEKITVYCSLNNQNFDHNLASKTEQLMSLRFSFQISS